MLSADQARSVFKFADTMGIFIKREDVLLRMSNYQDTDSINSSFYVYGKDDNKHFLGIISFQNDTSTDYNYFIDHEVISFLKEKGWI